MNKKNIPNEKYSGYECNPTKNYKKDPFLIIDSNLLPKLLITSDKLLTQLETDGQYFVAKNYPNIGQRDFKDFWKHIPINNPVGNKYSKNEYKGIYAFGKITDEKIKVLYVGISQTIRKRFFQHIHSGATNQASWAYNILKNKEFPDTQKLSPDQKQQLLKLIRENDSIHDIQKSFIKNCRFTFVKEDSNMMMHLAEVFCVNKLKSCWNSFETH